MKLFVTALLLAAGCNADTSRLAPPLEQQFTAEGVLHRADNQVFRWTDGGGRTWENRTASIVVTNRTVYIHKNDKVGLRITPASRKECAVHRDGERVRIAFGRGRNGESWSFVPPEDAESWTRDIRAMFRQFECGKSGDPQ